MRTPQEIAEELAERGVDPTLSVSRMVEAARSAGVRAQTAVLKAGAFEHKLRSGQRVVVDQPRGTCGRRDAANLLGVSVKRVDQLRTEGVLRSESHPFTGAVWVSLEDVRAERRRRGLDRLATP